MDEINRRRRGHNFLPPAKVLQRIPPLYSTEKIELQDKTIWAHYFGPSQDFYVAEMDKDNFVAWGYVDLGFGSGEWGPFSLPEIESVSSGLVIIERDCWWEPKPAHEIDKIKT